MNLIEISEQLKDVPDQLLMKEVQSPSGAYPSYLVVTEMTRRKRMRDQAMKEAPSTTVVQDLTQPSREQMMAAMAATQRGMAPSSQLVSPEAPPPQAQQMSQPAPRLNAPGIMASQQAMNTLAAQDVMGAQEPRRMAGGGMVAFAEGGMPQYDDRGVARFQNTGEVREYGFGPYRAFPGLDRFFSSTPLGSEYETPAQTRARLRREAEQSSPSQNTAVAVTPASISEEESASELRRIQNRAGITSPVTPQTRSANAGITTQSRDARQSNAGRTPTFNFDPIPPLSLTPYVDPYEAEVKANAAAFRATREPTPQEIETERAAREIRYGEKVPFRMGFLEKEIGKREKDIEGRRSSNINEALIQTGLGVMRSKSPRFLGALGEGGTEGLSAYRQGLKDIREGEKDILQSKVSLANSQTLYDQGKFVDSEKAEDKAYQRYERGISRLSTENAMLARAQTQSIQAAQLAQQAEVAKNTAAINQGKYKMEQFKLPYDIQETQARIGLYGDQGAYYRSGGGRGGLGRLTDADKKAAEDFANQEIFKRMPKSMQPGSKEYKALWDQIYMEALVRREQGLEYKPGQVNPSGAALQRNPDGSLNYVPPK